MAVRGRPRPGGAPTWRSAGRRPESRANVEGVRLQDFWSRMNSQFGSMRAQTVARDHVFAALGGRSAVDALEAGVPVRRVWLAVCDEYEVPAKER
jgi:Protein of unknown function (DUF3046)